MKNTPIEAVENCRIIKGPLATCALRGNNGAFIIPYHRELLKVIVSDGGGWDHISISLPYRTPTWEEMQFVKTLFFKSTETAVQFHPPDKDYVNFCKNCLHIWRKQKHIYQLPPPTYI